MKRFILNFAFCLLFFTCLCLSAAAQRNVFYFDKSPALMQHSPVSCLYRIPEDSVYKIAYSNGTIAAGTSWLQQPSYTAPFNRADSLLATDIVQPGYYVTIQADANIVSMRILHKPAFTVSIHNIERTKVLTVTDLKGKEADDMIISLEGKKLLYNAIMQGYVLKDVDEKGLVSVSGRGDRHYYLFTRTHNEYNPYRDYSSNNDHAAEDRNYKGYLVTNKPKYLPGDTVKFKAYILYQNNRPVKEPLTVSFGERYGYDKRYKVFSGLQPEEPGVYFSEFVLGDTVQMDREYQLKLVGVNTDASIEQTFRTEDYLLDETHLSVRTDGAKITVRGDSMHIFASAYDANNLPVLDGKLTLTVTPETYDLSQMQEDRTFFLPDTLYHITTEVSPDGETDLGFMTDKLPGMSMRLRCHVRLVNSNFESRDTTFFVVYTARSVYFDITQSGNSIKAVLTNNHQPVEANGSVTISYANRLPDTLKVRFPYEHKLSEDAVQIICKTDDPGLLADKLVYTIPPASFQHMEDFIRDTAYLVIRNPEKVLFRYSYYMGNVYKGYGVVTGDTVLKFRSKRHKTITVIGTYTWNGRIANVRYEVYKMDKELQINLDKKDFVYPGQSDSMLVQLRNKDGKGIGHTNLTVLAFNSNFTEDYTPDLSSISLLRPAFHDPEYTWDINQLSYRSTPAITTVNEWLSKCGADTVFFYKHLFLMPDDIAWVYTPLKESVLPQVGFFLKKGNAYLSPEVVYIDGIPVYFRKANTTNPQALFVKPGKHQVQLRMANELYTIPLMEICDSMKTSLFINADSVGPQIYYTKDSQKHVYYTHLYTFIGKDKMPDTFTYAEKDLLAKYFLLYRNEYAAVPLLYQYPNLFRVSAAQNRNTPSPYGRYNYLYTSNAVALVGPFNMNEPITFFQFENTKLRFQPELHQVFSFRPQMTRVERQPVYDYLSDHLYYAAAWPDIGMTTPNPPDMDSLLLTPRPIVREKEIILSVKSVQQPSYASALQNARFQLVSDTATKYCIWYSREKKKDIWFYASPSKSAYRIMPGLYDLLIIDKNNNYKVYEKINLLAGGANFIDVQTSAADPRIDYDHPPALFRPFIRRDTFRNRIVGYQRMDNYGNTKVDSAYLNRQILIDGSAGEIAGKVLDEKNEPVEGAIVRVTQAGVAKGGAATDENGNYSVKPLGPGYYDLAISYAGYKSVNIKGIVVIAGQTSYQKNLKLLSMENALQSVSIAWTRPLVNTEPSASRQVLSAEDVKYLPTRSTETMLKTSTGMVSVTSGAINIGGARSQDAQYIIDGQIINGSRYAAMSAPGSPLPDPEVNGKKGKYLSSEKSQNFINDFIGNQVAASGMRKDFRDWAIWEPDLWTDAQGDATFKVRYPDNMTSWKTYVLAMNRKGYAAKAVRLTRSFKPLSASLSLPRFLRYGDQTEAIGKVANFTRQSFSLRSRFLSNDTLLMQQDSLTVNTAYVAKLWVNAPKENKIDTTDLTLKYDIQAPGGFADGEERTIPVLPVGTVETKGAFVQLYKDTAFSSAPDSTAGYFTGRARIYADGNLLEVMLREIENLKVYPHGCTEQLTTKLLSIYYEEEIKRILDNKKLNNKKEKKEILEKLVRAQNRDGSFGWWSGNANDYRITNYVISTMQKINNDGWLDIIIRRGLTFLNNNLDNMNSIDLVTSLNTLSQANYAANYKTSIERVDTLRWNAYNRFALIKIKKEQGLPYRADLDTMVKKAQRDRQGIFWGQAGYDWYRDDLATTLLAYQLIRDDSVYGYMKTDILTYLLYKRQYGYYGNTASSGLVLTTLLPELLKNNGPYDRNKKTTLIIEGSIRDTVRAFPQSFSLKDRHPSFRFRKSGISPLYVSVVYDYFNINPLPHDSTFSVRSYFIKQQDTLQSLKQGEKVTMRVVVSCAKESEYVMVEIPLPAGCVPVNKGAGSSWFESSRETFKDRVAVYCRKLNAGTYTFDVMLENRYKGSYNISPARASMMYFPAEYGNNEVRKIRIE